jgi:hypothetical protein
LWGHSGGGFWASLVQTLAPERIVAIWLRSGTARYAWESGEIDRPQITQAVYQVPVMCNPGIKERDDERFGRLWTGLLDMFHAYREQGAPIGFAPDPRTSHECGDSRYLAIPFFDACLAMRLPVPAAADQTLKPVDMQQAWLAPLLGEQVQRADAFEGDPSQAVWLPNATVAAAWVEYVMKGVTRDTTPPPAPRAVAAAASSETITLTWEATADLDSGLRQFVIYRDGQELARLPQEPKGRFGRPLFQGLSYHDTPEPPLAEMRYLDQDVPTGSKPRYAVAAVNSEGLMSERSSEVIAE